jgi:hypothetical protein
MVPGLDTSQGLIRTSLELDERIKEQKERSAKENGAPLFSDIPVLLSSL